MKEKNIFTLLIGVLFLSSFFPSLVFARANILTQSSIGIMEPVSYSVYVAAWNQSTFNAQMQETATTINAVKNKYIGYDYISCALNPEGARNATKCADIYSCGIIIPRMMGDDFNINKAKWLQCHVVTPPDKAPVINVSFTPAIGNVYGFASFIMIENRTFDNTTGKWVNTVNVPLDEYFSALEIISTCPPGQMLRKTGTGSYACYNAIPMCINTQGTNVCEGWIKLYCLWDNKTTPRTPEQALDYCKSHPSSVCADGQKGVSGLDSNNQPIFNGNIVQPDGVCDDVISLDCLDNDPVYGNNGICDWSDRLVSTHSCRDENMNGICDNVEGNLGACFCPTIYNPVCVEKGSVTIGGVTIKNQTTYPNACFASNCSKEYVFTQGACVPSVSQCVSDSDCPDLCHGGSGTKPKCTTTQTAEGAYVRMCDYTEVYCTGSTCDDNDDCNLNLPCPGISGKCQISEGARTGYCQYSGYCATTPEKLSWWDALIAFLRSIVNAIIGVLGWQI